MKISKNNKGFTLIELLATIAILAVVVSITLYVSLGAIEKSREKSYKVTINNIQKEAANYLLENSDRLFFISYGEDVDDLEKNIEYQCITVQNLIDMGYFDKDIIESKIDKNTKVNTNMYVYIKRDRTTKAINETVLISDSNNETCSKAVKAKGDVAFVVEPLGWSKEKKITLYYSLNNLNDVATIGDYKYDYKYDGTSENIYDNGTEKQIKVTSNGTLEGYITLNNEEIVRKSFNVDKIDNVGPVIELGDISQEQVRKTVIIPLKVSDVGSGVNYSSFDESDIEVKVGDNIISDISLSGDEKGNYNLIINNNKYNGEVAIKIARNSVYDNVGNSNMETPLETNIIFNNVLKVNYNANGGSGSMASTECIYGESCTLSANKYTRTGYTFLGWSKDKNATSSTYSDKYKFKTFSDENDITLYAVWKINKVYVRFKPNGGTVTETTANGKYTISSDDIIYKDGSILQHVISYGGALGSAGLANYNNSSYLNITRTGYVGVSKEEWKCLSGCTTSGKKYDQTVVYSASDFCDASNGDCIVVLGVNWKDSTPPTCSISATSGSTTLTATYFDNSGAVSYYGWSSTYSGTNSTTKTIDSTGTITYYVKDAAGNTGSCSVVISDANAVGYCSSGYTKCSGTGCECYKYAGSSSSIVSGVYYYDSCQAKTKNCDSFKWKSNGYDAGGLCYCITYKYNYSSYAGYNYECTDGLAVDKYCVKELNY